MIWPFNLIFKPTPKPMNPRFPFAVKVDGNDLVLTGIVATAFGGASDPMDNGETASGVNTKRNPDILGCAIPMDGYGVHSLIGSPIPKMPFGVHCNGIPNPDGAKIIITDPKTGKVVGPIPAIDLGPSGGTGHALDLTVAVARMFRSNATASDFEMTLNYRIINGAKYL